MISDNLYSQIQEDLVSCDRMQMLTLAAFGLERLWRMFEDWTKTEGDPLLYQKPNSFRQRVRDILDHIGEQIESRQEINPYEKENTTGDIFHIISTYPLEKLKQKKFYDIR